MDKKLLDMQILEMKLDKAEKELINSESKKQTQTMVLIVKEAQNKILALEEQAKKLLQELDKLKAVQEKGINLVEKYLAQDISAFNEEELSDFEVKVFQATNHLAELDNRMQTHNAQVKKIVFDFGALKKKAMVARQKHKESKEEYDKFLTEKEPEIKKLKAEIAKLEKEIALPDLQKYKAYKQDGIFPVMVPLTDKSCGGCRMELSNVAIDKLREKGVSECEHCRRLIYVKD